MGFQSCSVLEHVLVQQYFYFQIYTIRTSTPAQKRHRVHSGKIIVNRVEREYPTLADKVQVTLE